VHDDAPFRLAAAEKVRTLTTPPESPPFRLTSVSTEFLGWAGVGDAELVASSSELIASTSELFASPSELISSTSELLAPPSELIASPSELFAGVAVEAGVSVNSARARGAR
jgi:hypothetical protein